MVTKEFGASLLVPAGNFPDSTRRWRLNLAIRSRNRRTKACHPVIFCTGQFAIEQGGLWGSETCERHLGTRYFSSLFKVNQIPSTVDLERAQSFGAIRWIRSSFRSRKSRK